MLPEILTTNLCSLKAGVNRFTITVEITLNGKNEVQKTVVNNGVINSNARFTYVEAQKILDEKEGENYNLLSSLQQISNSLRKKRFSNGSLNLDIPEVELELDKLGNTTSINVKSSISTHSLIEEIMLLANQCIANHLSENKIKLIHRNHEKISHEDLFHINGLLSQLSSTDVDSLPKIPTSKDVQKLISQISNNEIKPLIESVLLRALPKANYSTKNKGHFGLSFENYCHFTSPIRRYPDLIIHRLLKGDKVESLEKTAIMNSNSEVVSLKAEREFTKIKQLRFLMNKENEVLSGRVNGMNRHGMFIQIDDILVDGYVRAEWMEDDYYYFDENFYYFIGRRYKQKYKFGQKVTVKILNISILQQRLDLKLV
jgi:ribonuclease R